MALRLKVLLALGLAALAQSAVAETPRAVVELFTSQGCASCPPADAVLADLAQQPEMIALSFPVDYWDYLGWKDTLAQPAFTARQKAYALSRSDRQVFTPQMVVNGVKSCVGSDRAQIERSIQAATSRFGTLAVDVSTSEKNGIVTIEIGEAAAGASPRQAEVWLLPVTRSQTVQVVRGENRGRAMSYANVVRDIRKLGPWTGEKARFEIPAARAREGGDGYVVLLQAIDDTRPSIILGAAKSEGL
ncbi:DUF1223 domain-containing protein [Microvirga flavescens]|uniref:DUF1223 domain-containing protein n=1 Tax=Microvirga flavescens TaxID=2249811 RepID=UPI0018E07F13|nr:DUF1223 domain-containing protein [Microvirga flavescens]